MDTQKLIDEASPTIGDTGWAFYFVPSTIARGADLGLDMFEFYFLGRGGVLGDVDASVVSAAFGYFNPNVLATVWDAARAKVRPREAGREFFEAAHEFGRERLEGLAELEGFVAASGKVIDAARQQVAGLSLFAAASAEPVPDDLPAAAMHHLVVLRELRGSAHLLAVVAEGLEPRVAHFVRRPEMFEAFGWQQGDQPPVSDTDRTSLAAADARTDRLLMQAYGVLDEESAIALLQGLAAMGPRLSPKAAATD